MESLSPIRAEQTTTFSSRADNALHFNEPRHLNLSDKIREAVLLQSTDFKIKTASIALRAMTIVGSAGGPIGLAALDTFSHATPAYAQAGDCEVGINLKAFYYDDRGGQPKGQPPQYQENIDLVTGRVSGRVFRFSTIDDSFTRISNSQGETSIRITGRADTVDARNNPAMNVTIIENITGTELKDKYTCNLEKDKTLPVADKPGLLEKFLVDINNSLNKFFNQAKPVSERVGNEVLLVPDKYDGITKAVLIIGGVVLLLALTRGIRRSISNRFATFGRWITGRPAPAHGDGHGDGHGH